MDDIAENDASAVTFVVQEAETPTTETEETTEPETQATVTEPEKVSNDEYEKLKAENAKLMADRDRLSGRLGAVKSTQKALASIVKAQLNDGLIDDEVTHKAAGMELKRIEGMLNAPDIADNPLEAQKQAFERVFAVAKPSIDRFYKEDTGKYARAFGDHADNELITQFMELSPEETPAFVVEKGKEILEKYGDGGRSAYIAKLEKEIADLKAGKVTENQPQMAASTQERTRTSIPAVSPPDMGVDERFKRLF